MVTILGSVRMDNSWTSITCHYQHSIQVHCDKWWKHSKKGQGWHRCMWEEIDIRFGIYYHNLDNLSVTSSGLRHFSKCQLAWCRLWRVSDIRDRACVLLDQSWSSQHSPHSIGVRMIQYQTTRQLRVYQSHPSRLGMFLVLELEPVQHLQARVFDNVQ